LTALVESQRAATPHHITSFGKAKKGIAGMPSYEESALEITAIRLIKEGGTTRTEVSGTMNSRHGLSVNFTARLTDEEQGELDILLHEIEERIIKSIKAQLI
jgi:hypothetical protein